MQSILKPFPLVLLALLLLGGCGGTVPTGGDDGAPVETRQDNRVDVIPAPVGGAQDGALPPTLADPNSILSKRSVYFAFDNYNVPDEYRELVTAHARFLAGNRQLRVLIQGNTDERGSREYNLSLGQKRAEAVRQMLLLLGVQEGQIEAVSLGEEKPRAEGHTEAAWAENRRSDILYLGEF
ncbi:MAG: peptidoglycan-associated lipoprotein Pal [Zoogloeaceae bacterium]|jgi:peptidoglycan-associated lipoprotein|nr:peptidoglycan-associated lipoprotein Pal [Zoogloeaceae bacterium]